MVLQIKEQKQASNLVLLYINSITNTFPKTNYAVYFKVPHLDVFKNINQLKQIMIVQHQITFKIVNYKENQENQILLSGQLTIKTQPKYSTAQCKVSNNGYQIYVKGSIINQNKGQGRIFDFYVDKLIKYEEFFQFRKKYKTLENITKKLQFKLDHRLKIITSTQDYYFTLQQGDKHYFISPQKVRLVLEQIYIVDDFQYIEQLYEQQMNLLQLIIDKENKKPSSYDIKLNYQQFTINMKANQILNENISQSQIMIVRVLQLYNQFGQKNTVKLGTDTTPTVTVLQCLLDNKYYDYQYGYLCKNLSTINKTSDDYQIFENLQKLTKFTPKYPNFKNQALIDVRLGQFLQLTHGKQKYSIPFIYLLRGYNIFHTKFGYIKLFIQFQKSQKKQQKDSKKRRIYQMNIKDIWNLSSSYSDDFTMKIISEQVIYYIPFSHQIIDKNTFKKQTRELQTRNQYSQMLQNKFLLLYPYKDNKIKLIKAQFNTYLIDLIGDNPISFQICSKQQVLMSGILPRSRIINKADRIILSSSKNNVVVKVQFFQIGFKNQSFHSMFEFKYKLQYPDTIIDSQTHYDLQIKSTSKKSLRKQIKPYNNTPFKKLTNKQQVNSFYVKACEQQYKLSLRKMHYDIDMNLFDNQSLVQKTIIINPEGQNIKHTGKVFRLQPEQYEIIEIDFYDNNVKQRLKLFLEIFHKKTPILDLDHSEYIFRIPKLLWHMNDPNYQNKTQHIEIQSILNHRKKKGQSIKIPYGSMQEYKLPAYNYKDALCIKIDNELGYGKVEEVMKTKCDVIEKIGWVQQSQWYLTIISLQTRTFYLLLKTQFNANAQLQQKSKESQKTVSRGRSKKSTPQKVNTMARTMRNMDVLNLKIVKNDAIKQNRILTTKIVQKQERVQNLNKKIIHFQQLLKKRKQQLSIPQIHKPKAYKQHAVMNKFYRQICQCGYKNPQFNGYCEQCLTKLRKRYQIYMLQYKQKCYEYEKMHFDTYNKKQKIEKAKTKLKSYYEKIKSGQTIQQNNIGQILNRLESKSLKNSIEELKIDLYTLEQQRKSLTETVSWQQQKLERQIKKQDEDIFASIQQMQILKAKMKNLNNQIKQASY